MRIENQKMQTWLKERGINAMPKFIWDGSMKRTWRLYNLSARWSEELATKLNELGFTNHMGLPLGKYDGNGGAFSTFVRHKELTPLFTDGIARP